MPTYYPIDETTARRAKEMSSFYNYKPGSATASYRQEVDKAAIAEAQKARVDPMYHIDEPTARLAKQMNSFYEYKPGSATAAYRQEVDKAAAIAEAQKARVDPMYHEKIDRLLDTYARKLAENLNHGYAIAARCPSVLIAGPANFLVRKKEKQNRAADANIKEWQEIQGILSRIRGVGTAGISSDDENALQKLRAKLARHEREQEEMKAINAYYRKHGTLDGCPFSRRRKRRR